MSKWWLVCMGAMLTALYSCSSDGTITKKLIILGIDGMDPKLLQGFMREGKLPHFAWLAATGDLRPLTTSIPPQSPVAWSNLITGMDPGGHGIFDFIHRDPATLLPYLSTSKVDPPKRTLKVGDWVLPLSGGKVSLLRYGKAFWEILDEHRIPATIFRIPANFPPVKTKAHTFAGMGTPDLQGTYGTFSFYTDSPLISSASVTGGQVYPVEIKNSKILAQVVGPPNSFKKGSPPVSVDFTVWIDPSEPVAKISVQDHEFLLCVGEWSEWVQMKFELVPYLASVSGICKFYLKQIRPDFELYVSPINIDPSDPALPMSTPERYARELSEDVGHFYTQGIAEDTKALTSGILNNAEYLTQARMVMTEQLRIFSLELQKFHAGVFFFYFSSIDQNSHMFWRAFDERHPAYSAGLAAKYSRVVEELYQEMDRMLGQVRQKLDENTTLLVLSDHGFAPYYRSFNLNTWLRENGYIVLRDELQGDSSDLFGNVDWTKTRAYGLGLNGLYLNLRGREREGIVESGSAEEELLAAVTRKLLELEDPLNRTRIISRIDKAKDIYRGPYVRNAPDLLIGYNYGYRAGWDTILGKFSSLVLEDNLEPWSGDHCIDLRLVPGVLLSNRKIQTASPALTDVAPTILAEFGIEKPDSMIGASVLGPAARGATQSGSR